MIVCEGDNVDVMHDSGEVISGRVEIATNALWADVEVIAVVKRVNNDDDWNTDNEEAT
jgi:hypothetical protein